VERWEKWQEKENERRKRRDEKLAKFINGFLWVMGWIERKFSGPPKPPES
jgi:hypothetical protein